MVSGDRRISGDNSDNDDYLRPPSSSRAHISSRSLSSRSPNGPRETVQSRLLPPQWHPTLILWFLYPSWHTTTRARTRENNMALPPAERTTRHPRLRPPIGVISRHIHPSLHVRHTPIPWSQSATVNYLSQAGMLAGAFTFAQFLTALLWGRLSIRQTG